MGSIKDIKFLLKSRILNSSTQAAPDKKATGAEDAEWLGLVWAFLGVFFFRSVFSWTEVNIWKSCMHSIFGMGSPGVCPTGPCRNCLW